MEHKRGGQLEFDLEQCDERQEPAMPVTVRFLDEWHDAELYGCAADLRGANDAWRRLFFGVREFAPGFHAGFLTWVRAENIPAAPWMTRRLAPSNRNRFADIFRSASPGG